MGKPSHSRSLQDSEAMAIARRIRVGPQKLNLIAALIRGRNVDEALIELAFSKKFTSREVRKVLQSAIANAENNHQLDVDRLYVSEVSVGRSMVMKRWRARARGRSARIVKPWSRLRMVVREREEG